MKNRIGVLCPSEIAYRRFMPALMKITDCEYVGIAHANEKEWFGSISEKHDLSILEKDLEKCTSFKNEYGGIVFDSYEALINSCLIDSVYIPLPPALHYFWAKKALLNGKNVLVEKPATDSFIMTNELVEIARRKGLALHENYMFNFHSQLEEIENIIHSDVLGELRLIRIDFGFPFRGVNDFRYNKKLGGGALLDCGGYTLKLAERLLGPSTIVKSHVLNYIDGIDVDVFGSGVLVNSEKQVAQISFGMDNAYRCNLDIWGSKGSLFSGRVLTAPPSYHPTIELIINGEKTVKELPPDDTFLKSIQYFNSCILSQKSRESSYEAILKQARLVDEFKED